MSTVSTSTQFELQKRNRLTRSLQLPRDMPAFLSSRSLESLRKITDDPTAFPEFIEKRRDHRDAADIAIFAHNASLDNAHLENDQFHPAFLEFRKNTRDPADRARITLRLKRAVQDHAALLDQITGGTTLVVSIPGALEPNTPAAPEYIKAYSYFPSTILKEVTSQGDADIIDDIVQIVIRELGVPTVRRFERALKKTWNHIANTRNISSVHVRPLPEVKGIPNPIPDGSSRYLFYGRSMPVGTFSALRNIEKHMHRQTLDDDKAKEEVDISMESVWSGCHSAEDGSSTMRTGSVGSGGGSESSRQSEGTKGQEVHSHIARPYF